MTKMETQNERGLAKIILATAVTIIVTVAVAFVTTMSFGHHAEAEVAFDQLPDNKSYNDFVVGPGKIEVELAAGESKTIELTVSNRLGMEKTFTMSVEDFMGSNDPTKTVVLLGDDHGPYSLRDYLKVGTSTVKIPNGIRARIPVTIKIPNDAQPGGLYGSVITQTLTKNVNRDEESGAKPSSTIITRIGTLFFVRVKGNANIDGHLEKFQLTGNQTILWNSESISFDLLYKNSGNVHLDPYGTIGVSNMLGSSVASIEVEPWFAMPQSLRFRQVEWTPPFLFGRYVAHAVVNRGYASATDEMDAVFWVIPWKIIAGILVVIIVIVSGLKWILSKFTITRKA
jgi:hypothetical protein